MSCDLLIINTSDLEVSSSVKLVPVPLFPNPDDSTPSSANLSSAEDCDSSSPSESPVHMLRIDFEQDKDSGIEFCVEDGFQPLEGLTPPGKELMKGIIDMVEFYFSDANLLKDTFLLKHVRRNKEGYVSLKLITNFRKVKTYTRDWRVVAYSLMQSTQMQVNDQCTKVRRKAPLPSFDETQSSRTIIITGLPSVTSVDALELVSGFGEIVCVRLIKPNEALVSSDQHKDLKKFLSRRPDLEGCVLVEFALHDSAAQAVKAINNSDSLNYSAYALNDKSPTAVQGKPQRVSNNNNNKVKEQTTTKKVRRNNKKEQQKTLDSSDSEHQYSPELRRRSSSSVSSGYFSSSPRYSDFFERRFSGRSASISSGSNTSTPVVRPRNRLDSAPVSSTSGSSAETSPWVQRRIASRSQTQSGVVVLREPRGPDGTTGFHQPRVILCA